MLETRLLVTLLLACAAPATLAQWKWQDRDGHVVFSDRAPPADISERDILLRPAVRPGNTLPSAPQEAAAQTATPAVPTSAVRALPVDKELEARKKQLADAADARKKAEEARLLQERHDNCIRAQSALATLASGSRMTRHNAAGEREFMDEASRNQETRRLQAVAAADCTRQAAQ
jgi:hypothetical protein